MAKGTKKKATVLAAIAAPTVAAPTVAAPINRDDEYNGMMRIHPQAAAPQIPTGIPDSLSHTQMFTPDYSAKKQVAPEQSMTDKLKGWWNSLQEKPVAYDGKGAPVMGSSQLDTSAGIADKAFLGQKLMQDQYEKENQQRANQSASQGPQMLEMIHKIYGANAAAQQRSSALSALAGR